MLGKSVGTSLKGRFKMSQIRFFPGQRVPGKKVRVDSTGLRLNVFEYGILKTHLTINKRLKGGGKARSYKNKKIDKGNLCHRARALRPPHELLDTADRARVLGLGLQEARRAGDRAKVEEYYRCLMILKGAGAKGMMLELIKKEGARKRFNAQVWCKLAWPEVLG
jgi:hypothetical protein